LPVSAIAHSLFLLLPSFPLFAAKVKAGLTTVSITIDKVGLKVRSQTARAGQLANCNSSIFDLAPFAHMHCL
jgi:hypothetical protein